MDLPSGYEGSLSYTVYYTVWDFGFLLLLAMYVKETGSKRL